MGLARRQRIIATSVAVLLLSIGFTVYFNLNHTQEGYAAVSGDYRTIGSGNWTQLSIWQRYNGTAWVAATAIPGSANNVINIQSGHNVTVNASVTADQVDVNLGGTLTLSNSAVFTLNNGTGTDLTVNGTLVNSGSVITNTGANISFSSTGLYRHAFTNSGGTIPTASWASGSTCEISGYINPASGPSNLQAFSNVVWNCPSQNTNIVLAGGLTNIGGNFSVVSTGSRELRLATSNSSLNIGGDLNISGGTLLCQNQDNTTYSLTVAGNFIQSGGAFELLNCQNSTGTFNVSGNLTTTGGNWRLTDLDNNRITSTIAGNYSQSSSTNAFMLGKSSRTNLTVNGNFTVASGTLTLANDNNDTAVVNLRGDYAHTGGTVVVNGNSATYAQMIFSKTGTQTFSASGNTVTGSVDFIVNNGSTLNLGTSILTGRNFTLQSGGGLQLGSTAGISASGSTGNIQASGTRSFSTTADYTYNGTAAQVSGSGLPATVRNLILNNSNGLTLSAASTVTGTLTLTSGKINTGGFVLAVSNTSTSSIVSSSSNYIIGNLRRSVTSSGSYLFPLGTATQYEGATLALSGTAGFSDILGSFTNTNPLNPAYPLNDITISGVEMTELLDYGFWTFQPNASLTAGTYTITAEETGHTNTLGESTVITLLRRNNASSAWTGSGTHNDNTQSVSGGTVTAVRSALNTFGSFAIAIGDFPSFGSNFLYSGTDGQIGAIYIFPNVTRGVDAWVQILDIQGGATLNSIDDQSTGYKACFQPFINYAPNREGWFEWKITFKRNGTSIDTTLRKLTATGVDVDGATSSGRTVREYIEATMPTSINLDPATTLTITNTNGRYRALGAASTFTYIDTVNRAAMYELNYNNVNTIFYRTGTISTFTAVETRQTSLYFKAFNLGTKNIALPIELMYFQASYKDNAVNLSWATASEINNDYFTIERSTDGINFEAIQTLPGAGNSTSMLEYQAVDPDPLPGYSFYRLKQTDYDGQYSYSEVETIKRKGGDGLDEGIELKSVFPNPFSDRIGVDFITKRKGTGQLIIQNESGSIVSSTTIEIREGYNNGDINNLGILSKGTYIVTLLFEDYKVSRKVVKTE